MKERHKKAVKKGQSYEQGLGVGIIVLNHRPKGNFLRKEAHQKYQMSPGWCGSMD